MRRMAVVGIVCLAGCVGVRDAELLERRVAAPARPLAACVYRLLQEERSHEVILTNLDDTGGSELRFSLKTGLLADTGGRVPLIEANFTPDGAATRLSYRSHPTVYGGDMYGNRFLLPAVGACETRLAGR